MAATLIIAAILIAASLGANHASAQYGQAMAPVQYGPAMAPDQYGPAMAPDCLTNLLNMSDCLSYVTAGSTVAKPDKACCPELAGLVESSPQCLCYLLGGDTADQYGIKIDMGRALKLPSVCGVETPPPSMCSLFGIPVASPTANEESIPPPVSPISPGAQSPEAFAASPATGNRDSKASPTAGSAAASLLGLVTLALVSIFF